MKHIFKLLAVLTLVLSSGSCKKSCTNQNIGFTSLENEYACENTLYNLEIDLENNFTVIQSQEVYDLLVGGCDVDFDFENFDLIIGKYNVGGNVTSVNYKYEFNCENQLNVLQVNIGSGFANTIENITYHVIVPNVETGTQVQVEIKITQS